MEAVFAVVSIAMLAIAIHVVSVLAYLHSSGYEVRQRLRAYTRPAERS